MSLREVARVPLLVDGLASQCCGGFRLPFMGDGSGVWPHHARRGAWENVPGGMYTLSNFDSNGIATGQMNTTERIVPLVVKNCQ